MLNRLKSLIGLTAMVLVVAACGGEAEPGDTPPAETTPAETTPEETMPEETTPEETTAPDTTSSEDLPVVRLSALSGGLTGVAQVIIEENGFDTDNGFQGEYFYNDPDASGQFFLQGNSDIAFDYDVLGAAIARTQDLNVSVFYPILNNNNCVLVLDDSPYESPEDLVGETVGHFGADSGTTTSIGTTLSEFHDINVFEDYQLVETGPPALVELLVQGEVEAIFNFVPHSSRATIQAPARCILGPLNQTLAELPGGLQNHLSAMTAYEDWLAENPELAQAVMGAWDDAIAWIEEDPTRITEDPYREFLAQDDPEVLELIAQEVTEIPLFTNDWSEEVRSGAEAWVDLAAEQGILIDANPGGVITSVGE